MYVCMLERDRGITSHVFTCQCEDECTRVCVFVCAIISILMIDNLLASRNTSRYSTQIQVVCVCVCVSVMSNFQLRRLLLNRHK